ncbi:MAG TPA: ribbon-helix-helix protein, CopG family [Stellaceae bacterium]|nr:ribbon-helix-helix protein, CopG family [Stellaceae bacterium]
MTIPTKTTITTTLPPNELAALDRVRSRENRSRAALVREAIQWYLAAVDRLPSTEDPLPSEIEALREAEEEFARGQCRPLEDVLRDLGRPTE